MTLKDLKNIKEILIRVEAKEYKVNIVEISDMEKMITVPVSTINDPWLEKPADIFFTLNNKKYTFPANIYFIAESPKIVIIKKDDIVPDKRIQKRTKTDVLSATISAKYILGLLLSQEIEIKVVDLSESGAQIWSKEPLNADKQYKLLLTLKKHKISTFFEIKNNIGKKENTFVYGIHFTAISNIDKKVINKYLMELNGIHKCIICRL